MNKRPSDVINRFKKTDVGMIGISSITVSELQYGVVKSKYQNQKLKRLEEFLMPFEILAYDQMAANCYGEIRSKLEKQGHIIGPLDLLIAAHALSKGLILVTNNEKKFKRIKSLKVENWVK
ncbi:MAG: type II toxin-antitoxin system VapC family toxin [Desulfobacteraceae bacterium]|nr:type II toxin-antitoxin system VapC family toxin [Desulfobacteraceae bacterium]